MLKSTLVAWLVLLYALPIVAQQINYQDYKKRYPDSEYVILENKYDLTYFIDKSTGALKAKLTYTTSILLLDDNSGRIDFIQIPYSMFQDLTITNARYFKIDSLNKKVLVENVKVRQAEDKNYYIENIFYSDLKVKQFASVFPTKERSLLTYSYEKIFHDLKFIDRIDLQQGNADVEVFECTVKTPKLYNVDHLLQPINLSYDDYSIQESEDTENKISKIKILDLKTKKQHKLLPPSNYYLPHFLILTKSYQYQGNKIAVIESADDLYRWYNSLVKQLPAPAPEVEVLSKLITKDAQTDEDKIDAIFKWVQRNINYVAFEDGIAGFRPERSVNVVQSRFGDCKGMANLLVDLLRLNGFEAYHTWIGSRSLHYTYKTPSLYVDNHMICGLKYKDSIYFLDATSKTVSWKFPPSGIQGKEALVGMGESYKIIKVPTAEASTNLLTINAEVNLSIPMAPIVKGTLNFTGELLDNVKGRFIYYGIKEQKLIPYLLTSEYISSVQMPTASSQTNTDKEMSIGFKSTSLTNICLGSNQLMINGDIDRAFYGTYSALSNIPIYINKPITIRSTVKYILPPGSVPSVLPKEVSIESPEKEFMLKTSYTVEGNTVIYRKELSVNTLLVTKIKEWDNFILQLEKSYDELLTIKLK